MEATSCLILLRVFFDGVFEGMFYRLLGSCPLSVGRMFFLVFFVTSFLSLCLDILYLSCILTK